MTACAIPVTGSARNISAAASDPCIPDNDKIREADILGASGNTDNTLGSKPDNGDSISNIIGTQDTHTPEGSATEDKAKVATDEDTQNKKFIYLVDDSVDSGMQPHPAPIRFIEIWKFVLHRLTVSFISLTFKKIHNN